MRISVFAPGIDLFGKRTVQADSCLHSKQIDTLFISVGGQEKVLGGGQFGPEAQALHVTVRKNVNSLLTTTPKNPPSNNVTPKKPSNRGTEKPTQQQRHRKTLQDSSSNKQARCVCVCVCVFSPHLCTSRGCVVSQRRRSPHQHHLLEPTDCSNHASLQWRTAGSSRQGPCCARETTEVQVWP